MTYRKPSAIKSRSPGWEEWVVGWLADACSSRWWYGFFPVALFLVGVGSEGMGGRVATSQGPGEVEVLVRFEGQVEDGAPVEGVAFYRLLAQVAGLPEQAWQATAPEVTAEQLAESPHRFRGRMVEVLGAVLETAAWELPGNPSGLETVLLVHLVDEADRLVTAVVTREPRGWERGEGARVRGVFFKIWRYQSRGGTWEEAPLLVARQLLPAPPAAVRGKAGEALMGLAVAVGMALVLFVALRFWLGWSRQPVRFRLPGQGDGDGRGAGSRRVG